MNKQEKIDITIDHLIYTVGQNANPEKFDDENVLEAYANDYVKFNWPDLEEQEQDEIIKAAVKEYIEL